MDVQPLGYSLTKTFQPYEPKEINPLNVVFLPVVKSTGMEFVAAATNDKDDIIRVENLAPPSSFSQVSAFDSPDDEDDENKYGRFDLGKDGMATFYIGSVTVIGLYILFRLLHKTK